MINWINFLHFYQPPTTKQGVLDEVVKTCYQPWADFFNTHPEIKMTINITACLTDLLAMHGYKSLINDFKKIIEKKQIELIESVAFHPILPLINIKEAERQIKINNKINKEFFGDSYKPLGFFLPEMAYSKEIADLIKKLGYKYIILDEISLSGKLKNKIDYEQKYKLKNGLQVVFRNRKISQSFVPETIINLIESAQIKKKTNIITATDAELYGHRFWNWWPPLEHLTKTLKVKTLKISEYLASIKKAEKVNPKASNWESGELELKNKIPYALWKDPKNKIHSELWKLADLAIKLNQANSKDKNYYASVSHLEKGLASCTFWWASARDFKLYNPPAWNPEMVENGAQELLSSIRSLDIKNKEKIKAEKLFSKIKLMVWEKHWRKYANNK